jgi:hypothetical protein
MRKFFVTLPNARLQVQYAQHSFGELEESDEELNASGLGHTEKNNNEPVL